MIFTINVSGTPGPKGSRKFKGFDGRGKPFLAEDCDKVKPWADAVIFEAKRQIQSAVGASVTGQWTKLPLFSSAVTVEVWFFLVAPARMPKGRLYPTVTPDLDKLARGTLDPLKVARVLSDDAIVVDLHVYKRYVGPDTGALRASGKIETFRPEPGAMIMVTSK